MATPSVFTPAALRAFSKSSALLQASYLVLLAEATGVPPASLMNEAQLRTYRREIARVEKGGAR